MRYYDCTHSTQCTCSDASELVVGMFLEVFPFVPFSWSQFIGGIQLNCPLLCLIWALVVLRYSCGPFLEQPASTVGPHEATQCDPASSVTLHLCDLHPVPYIQYPLHYVVIMCIPFLGLTSNLSLPTFTLSPPTTAHSLPTLPTFTLSPPTTAHSLPTVALLTISWRRTGET